MKEKEWLSVMGARQPRPVVWQMFWWSCCLMLITMKLSHDRWLLDYNYKMLTTPGQFTTACKNKHSTGLRITGQYFFFFIKCQIIWRRKDCLDVDVCLVATLSVTLAFMIEQSEPVGDSSHEHCSAETEESQHRAVFYRWDGGQSWHCLPLLYTCTLPRECLGCQATDSAPHVESREEDLLFGLTPITRSHHPLSDIKHFCVSTNMICCNFMKSLS